MATYVIAELALKALGALRGIRGRSLRRRRLSPRVGCAGFAAGTAFILTSPPFIILTRTQPAQKKERPNDERVKNTVGGATVYRTSQAWNPGVQCESEHSHLLGQLPVLIGTPAQRREAPQDSPKKRDAHNSADGSCIQQAAIQTKGGVACCRQSRRPRARPRRCCTPRRLRGLSANTLQASSQAVNRDNAEGSSSVSLW